MASEVKKDYQRGVFQKHKKKKRLKFVQNVKGYAKKGNHGRGTRIDDDQFNYFLNILDALNNEFEDIEDKVNMANNVFQQTKDQEIHLASNQIVSNVLESLLAYVDSETLETYFKTFSDSFRPICSDPYASHVLQKMVEIAFLRSRKKGQLKKDVNDEEGDKDNVNDANESGYPLAKRSKLSQDILSEENYNLETKFSKDHKANCAKFVLRVGKFMLNNLEDFVWDFCASHIMRTCIFCLSGIHVAKLAFKKEGVDIAKSRKIYEVPSEWHEVAKEFAQRLEMWPQLSDLPYQEYSSALLGVLCIALKVIDKNMLKHFGKKILNEAFLKVDVNDDEKLTKIQVLDEGEEEKRNTDSSVQHIQSKLPKVFEYQSSVVLLETLLTVAGPKLLTQLYATLFTNKLALLSKMPLTNFAVQKLLMRIKEKEDFENVFQELEEYIEEIIKIGHTGVIAFLSSACLRLQTKQTQLMKALQTALHVNNDKERIKSFFACLVKLKPFEFVQQDESSFVHLHGSLIIQNILRFNKPILMVNCILETSPDYLVTVLNTPNGSYICNVFLQSKFIGEKSREKFLKHLDGFYVDLAITKFGSRVVEACFNSAQDIQKAKIVKELADKFNMVKSSPFGKFINRKLRVETYRLSVTQWRASLHRKESKVQQLFKDIIN